MKNGEGNWSLTNMVRVSGVSRSRVDKSSVVFASPVKHGSVDSHRVPTYWIRLRLNSKSEPFFKRDKVMFAAAMVSVFCLWPARL